MNETQPLTDPDARLAGRVPGLPDDAFDHDGLVTKRNVRASALAHLRPRPGELLWDIGAGAGSVGIEWCRTDATCRALAVERRGERAQRCLGNIARLTMPGQLELVEDEAVAAMRAWLQAGRRPDAIFVGGGGCEEVLALGWEALQPGGRFVIHGVTVETEALVLAAHAEHGGDLVRLGVETADRIGRLRGWQPARTIVAWCGVKG